MSTVVPPFSDSNELVAAMFLKDPRGTNHLEARRGFQSLDKCEPKMTSSTYLSFADSIGTIQMPL